MDKPIITSWKDLQKNLKKITILLRKDKNLMLAAASNPFFALEEIGFVINPELKDNFEDRMRFKTSKVKKLAGLRESIFTYAGRKFDIRNKNELNTVLFDELKLVAFDKRGCALPQDISTTTSIPKTATDELNEYSDLHPVIDPLIEFREIDRSVPGFCNKASYDTVRQGKLPVNSRIKLSIRFKI